VSPSEQVGRTGLVARPGLAVVHDPAVTHDRAGVVGRDQVGGDADSIALLVDLARAPNPGVVDGLTLRPG